jgi:hypothetical protein
MLTVEASTLTSVADTYRRKLGLIHNFIEQTVEMLTIREHSAQFLYQHLVGVEITRY